MTAPIRMPAEPKKGGRRAALADALARATTALECGVGTESALVPRFRGLCERLQQERLQLAVLGQFKRGKSTFINALLGAPLLPTGVVPLTSAATFIAWGEEPLVRVDFKDGRLPERFATRDTDAIRDFLFRFVAEEANPENRLGVERVELRYPAPILADGSVLIDTPGVGSTLRHNTDAAMRVLPECDAALFVLSADPPITEVEIEYLRHLKSSNPRVFFVLNKADYLGPDERQAISRFLRKVLSQNSLLDSQSPIFCVSARDGLAAKQASNRRDLERSGMAALEDQLLHRLATEKARWLENAVRTKATDILAQAAAELALRLRALDMPLEELESKSAAFKDALRCIQEQRRTTRDLLAGDHRRLRDSLELSIHALRNEASAKLTGVIEKSFDGGTGMTVAVWEASGRKALSALLEEIFDTGRDNLVGAFSTNASTVLSIHQRRIDALVDSVRRTAGEIFDVSFAPDAEHESFRLEQEPYWVTESVASTLIADSSRLIDRLLPAAFRSVRLRTRVARQADELILRNAENLRWAIVRGLDETFRRATARFEHRLDDAVAATKGVIENALARRRDQSFMIEPEIDRLNRATASLAAAHDELAGMPVSDLTAGADHIAATQ
jgi:GTP-binding protein EngB required for normal cell division